MSETKTSGISSMVSEQAVSLDTQCGFLIRFCYLDDKVSVVSREKILALEGGGEDSVAYILLYRSPTV